VATLHVAGVRGDPCGAVRWTVGQFNALHHKGHHVHLLHAFLPQHQDWLPGF